MVDDNSKDYREKLQSLQEERRELIRKQRDVIYALAQERDLKYIQSTVEKRSLEEVRHVSVENVKEWNDAVESIKSSDRFQASQSAIEAAEDRIDDFWKEVATDLVDPDADVRENIGTLWDELGSDIPSERIIETVGTSKSYIRKLEYDPEKGGEVLKDRVLARKRNRASPSKKEKIRVRDGKSCVRCGEGEVEQLEVHHIIPISEGGSNIMENLATLCKDCHKIAHGGDTRDPPLYQSKSQFWNWIDRGESFDDPRQHSIHDF